MTSARRGRWYGIVGACLAVILSVSCDSIEKAGQSTGGNLAGSLRLNKSIVNFGSVPVGSSRSSELTLTNISFGVTLTFSRLQMQGTGFGVVMPSLPLILKPRQSATITVTFKPTTARPVKGSLSFVVKDVPNSATVPLAGAGSTAPQLAILPPALNFGTVVLGSRLTKTATLSAGSSDVSVTSASWSGQGYSLSGLNFPVTVPAGKSVSFTVTFTPQAAAVASGGISFVSNAANSPSIENLTGAGSLPQSSPTSITQHAVGLSWFASSSPVIGYNTYRSSQSGGPYSRLNSTPVSETSYRDGNVQAGQTYYYVVTSVGSDSEESAFSGQATAVVPSP